MVIVTDAYEAINNQKITLHRLNYRYIEIQLPMEFDFLPFFTIKEHECSLC